MKFGVSAKLNTDLLKLVSFLTNSLSVSKELSIRTALPKSINIIAAQTENQYLKSIFYNVNRDLEEGLNFSSSLSKYPEVFDDLFVNVVRSGEATGNLEMVLNRLSEKITKDQSLSSKIMSALIYPIFSGSNPASFKASLIEGTILSPSAGKSVIW